MKLKPNYIEYERTIYQESLHRDYPTLQHALYPLHAGRCRIRGYPFETYKQPAAACQAYSPFNITGGEPSLNVRAIRHILERVRAYDITVNDFYIVTNGSATSRSEEFIEACAALYEYQEEKEQDSGHMLEMSDDRFHDPAEHAATLAALSPYPFFGVRGQAERIFLFREGRSTEGFPNPVHGIYLTEENYVYGDLCLNAEGMVLSNGDLSYARQREHALCPCGKLMQYLRMTLKKRQKERLYE